MTPLARASVACITAVAALAPALSGCGEEESPSAGGGSATAPEKPAAKEGGTIMIAGEKANDHGRKDVKGAPRVEVELDDFYFEPTVLTGAPGASVTLALTNEGKVPHNLMLEDQGVDRDVQPGRSATVEVRFPRSGELVFVCKFHPAQNMRGGLAVGGAGDDSGGGADDSSGSGDSGSGGSGGGDDSGGYGY